MIIYVNQTKFEMRYFPFFRKENHEDFQIWGMKYPSGVIEDVIIFEKEKYIEELKDYTKFLIIEYLLEEDDMLTPEAKKLKEDLRHLFEDFEE
jgi:hypothetical protein